MGCCRRQALRQHAVAESFDFALWMDSDNILVRDTCEDLLGNLVALRHGWHPSAGWQPGAGQA